MDRSLLLPPELLSAIFDSLLFRDIVRASLVSARWRVVAIAHPGYWSCVCVEEGHEPGFIKTGRFELATAQLVCSTLAPIDVAMTLLGSQAPQAELTDVAAAKGRLIAAFQANLYRCRSIRLRVTDPNVLLSAFTFSDATAPLLRTLDLSTNGPMHYGQLMMSPLGSSVASRVCVLRLAGISIAGFDSHPPFSSVEELSLQAGSYYAFQDFDGLFAVFPTLKHLLIDDTIVRDVEVARTPSVRAALPRLAKLSLLRGGCDIIAVPSEVRRCLSRIPDISLDSPGTHGAQVFIADFIEALSDDTTPHSLNFGLGTRSDYRARVMTLEALPQRLARRISCIPHDWPWLTGLTLHALLPHIDAITLPISDWSILFGRRRTFSKLQTIVIIMDEDLSAEFSVQPYLSMEHVEASGLQTIVLQRDNASDCSTVEVDMLAAFMGGIPKVADLLRLELHGIALCGAIEPLRRSSKEIVTLA
ncbi:hypothetical protein EXIGLDRAFT_735718 [Exidia glandulosa HHB12029]|uniref:F-box domain-containing protein n=1 Tax=Exidia glandulosa HHB12029 TaxID=1314781 RepID=A0A165PIX1_EXIGL|nr:hypothetical protein EXIGLDRAFT_735718 [Exidia glandulosa HHB12029]